MGRVISCGEAVRHLWEYLDHSLAADDQRAVEEHLNFCIQCCGELEFAHELRRLLGTADVAGLPGEVQERLVRFIDALPDRDEPGGTP